MLYVLKDEHHIEKYNGENIKISVGGIVKTVIANPTNAQLKMVGYLELVKSEVPEFNPDTQYLDLTYEIIKGKIHEKYDIKNIEEPIVEE